MERHLSRFANGLLGVATIIMMACAAGAISSSVGWPVIGGIVGFFVVVYWIGWIVEKD